MASANREMHEFKGLAINSGKVMARVCLYSAEKYHLVKDYTLESPQEITRDISRLDTALTACSDELERVAADVAKNVGKNESEIFIAHKHVLNDPGVVAAIKKAVNTDRKNLEWAITDVFSTYEEKFTTLDNEYLRDRSSDFGEIKRRLLNHLYDTRPGFICHNQAHCTRGKDRIIVAEEMTAEMMVHMKLENVLGIVTEKGGITSHAAIIARSLGIPAVSGIRGIFDHVICGTELYVDGDKGVVITNPTEEIKRANMPAERADRMEVCLLVSPPGMQVMANTSHLDDVKLAATMHADGIGLFRTEIRFMQAERLLSTDEQYDYYAEAVRCMGDRPVTFRLLDVGGDKELPFLRIRKESNPFLGWRGARFLLANEDIFASQVRALVRLSRHTIANILIPMIIDAAQCRALIDAIRGIMATEPAHADRVRIGAMFEVPSACLQAAEILKYADFGSIGSNDLIQYLFAVDRNNDMVSQDYDPEHPVLWNLLENLQRDAAEAGKPLSICGEMAGREGMVSRLIDTGITTLSVSPRLIPRVRNEMTQKAGAAV